MGKDTITTSELDGMSDEEFMKLFSGGPIFRGFIQAIATRDNKTIEALMNYPCENQQPR
jgi:hypothetical protein